MFNIENDEMVLFENECKLLRYRGDMSKHKDGNFYFNDQTNWMYQMWISSKNVTRKK